LIFVNVIFLSQIANAYLPPKYGGTLTVTIPEKIYKYDPSVAVQNHELMIIDSVFDTLIKPGMIDGFVPVLLETLPVASDDRMTYYFKLREDIKFHDGSQLDSNDVLYTFKQLAASKRSPYVWIISEIEGMQEFRSGAARTIEGLKIVDAFRFEIHLRRAQPEFLKYLCFPALSVLPSIDQNFDSPVGSGPFRFIERNSKGEVIFAANESYFNGRPYLGKIVFKTIANEHDRITEFKRKMIDVTELPSAGIAKSDQSSFDKRLYCKTKRMYFVDINPSYEATRKLESRKEIASSIDRESIVKIILRGNGVIEGNEDGSINNSVKLTLKEDFEEKEIWYSEENPALKLISERIKIDLAEIGIVTTTSPHTTRGLLQYPVDNAPCFILRSLPVLLGLNESVYEPLFNSEYRSQMSSIAVRIEKADNDGESAVNSSIVQLYSSTPSYLFQSSVFGIKEGAYGNPDFEEVFIRAESEKEQ